MEYQDYYKTLNIDKKATGQEIQKAYRSLARKYHPDINKEKNAEEKFKQINEAYEVLKDPEKRKLYDSLGANWKAGQQFNGQNTGSNWQDFMRGAGQGGRTTYRTSSNFDTSDFSDFFSSLFGGGFGGDEGAQNIFSNLGERANSRGGRRVSGRQASGFSNFSEMQEPQEQISEISILAKEAILGTERILVISSQDGKQKKLKIKIPAGTTDKKIIQIKDKDTGAIRIRINVTDDKNISIKGNDIYVTIPVETWEASLGTELDFNSFFGKIKLKLPAGTSSGKKLKLKGKGIASKTGTGDLYLIIQINIPKILNKEEKDLYEKLSKISENKSKDERQNI